MKSAYQWLMLIMIGCTMCGTANCVNAVAVPTRDAGFEQAPLPVGSEDELSDDQGGTGGANALDLPVPADASMTCTQGVNGPLSHQTRSTRHDLDLDTPNDADLPLFAACSGIARVHTEDSTRNFGNHVNIDRGDGTYCLLAHLKTVLVQEGDEVVAGQLVGVEGCTGFCTGDHVHMGVHRGDAGQMAQFGESVPASYRLANESGPVAGSDIACGIPASRSYVSALPVAHRHPDGTLVKTVGDARVYLLGNGLARHVANETVFLNSGFDFRDVVNVSDQELACYGAGSPLTAASSAPVGLRDGMLVREASQSDVYALADGIAMPVLDWQTFLWLGYDPSRIRFLEDGAIEEAGYAFGSCTAGFACLDLGEMSVCAGGDTGGLIDDEDPNLGSLLDLDGGEFGIAYLPPEGFDADTAFLFAAVTDANGNLQMPWSLIVHGEEQGAIIARMSDLAPGDRVLFRVELEDGDMTIDSCDVQGLQGTMLVRYDTEDLVPLAASSPVGGCAHAAIIPGIPEYDPDPGTTPSGGEPGEDDDPNSGTIGPGGGTPDPETPDAGDDPDRDAPDAGSETDSSPPPFGGGAGGGERLLRVTWQTPFGTPATRITLSGEYRLADGTWGFVWHDLKEVRNASEIVYTLTGVAADGHLRFSVEFEDIDGYVSWSCIAPFPPGTLQGSVEATVDGTPVPVIATAAPMSLGCELTITVP